MFFENLLALTHVMSFILFLYVVVVLISFKLLKEVPRDKTYKKPKTELEEILGF